MMLMRKSKPQPVRANTASGGMKTATTANMRPPLRSRCQEASLIIQVRRMTYQHFCEVRLLERYVCVFFSCASLCYFVNLVDVHLCSFRFVDDLMLEKMLSWRES